ncbi:hypothetical protein [Candidatus Similichlamydia laticola]|uniref:Uncharacterized protein n=1 Tax=Candidatus Similichlamydia laticola TaxID=2170265 RepID=A0A369KGD2_9BACT|nr:hypothetical protein [Candidatus Similichlamydia laticola]RDB31765.1 hypothetical protein HAT2_00145 [Candidatus Similichlamydia laticola]
MTNLFGWQYTWGGRLSKERGLASFSRPRHQLGRVSLRLGGGCLFRRTSSEELQQEILLGIGVWPFPTRSRTAGRERLNINLLWTLLLIASKGSPYSFLLITLLLYSDALLVLGWKFFKTIFQSQIVILRRLASRHTPLHSNLPGLCVRRSLLQYSQGVLLNQDDPNKTPRQRALFLGLSFWPFCSAAEAHIQRHPDLPRIRCCSLNLLALFLCWALFQLHSPLVTLLTLVYLLISWLDTPTFDSIRPRDLNAQEMNIIPSGRRAQ